LEEVNFELGSHVHLFDEGVFQESDLPEITTPKSVSLLLKDCLSNCQQLSSVTFEDGTQIRGIGEGCFARSAISRIVVPATATRIEAMCFADCSELREVIFEDAASLEEIGPEAFRGCSIRWLTLPERVRCSGSFSRTFLDISEDRIRRQRRPIQLMEAGTLPEPAAEPENEPTIAPILTQLLMAGMMPFKLLAMLFQ
jgi:hypothetical protein